MGRLVNGKYEKGDFPMQDAVPTKTSVFRQSDHDRQRADHKRELVQPYNRDGSPNPEFTVAFPDESKSEAYKFLPTNEELAKGQRNG